MLSALAGGVISSIASTFMGKALDAFTAYVNKQISMAELEARVRQALLETFAEVEKAQTDALARTYASFMAALQTSKLLQVVWASVTLSQLAVLLWHQAGIPALVYIVGGSYPGSGSTVEWAYLLVAFCLGAGPVVLNNGPGKIAMPSFKTPIGK